jgi:hypothetical protein
MTENQTYTLCLTHGSHTVSPDVAAEILRALDDGDRLVTIPVVSILEPTRESVFTINTHQIVGVLVSPCESREDDDRIAGVVKLFPARR